MESFFAGIMETEAEGRLRDSGDIRYLARDWRRDWRGKGRHLNAMTLRAWPFGYPRDAAMFSFRELYALADEPEVTRWGPNARRFTEDVYRHPEYRDASRNHDPRTVFEAVA